MAVFKWLIINFISKNELAHSLKLILSYFFIEFTFDGLEQGILNTSITYSLANVL